MIAAITFSRPSGALVRAALMIALVATPSLLLPAGSVDGTQLVTLLALFVAALTLAEYGATYPGLIEFRDAPPFNRLRFLSLFLSLLLLSVIAGPAGSDGRAALLVRAVGAVIGEAMDFPLSPVRLVVLSVAQEADAERAWLIRAAAGMSYLVSLLVLGLFVILTRACAWPCRDGAFNVWINLPTFDPTAPGDVVARLERDGRVNIILGFLLPFLIPFVVGAAASVFEPVVLASPHTLVWTISLWAFLPASLFMRGIALGRIAAMIREKRRETHAEEVAEGWQPV